MNILVVGGAGFIGSHVCKGLSRAGHCPVVFDNLSTGHEWAVKWGPFFRGDLLDPQALGEVFADHRIDAVMHFAARSQVAESVREPALYLRNNVVGTLNLLEAMRTAGVGWLVFSSTAAVYGNPEYVPLDEAHPTLPINPYGWSKLMAERAIAEYCRAYAMSAAILRYFNAAGADSDGEIGEVHEPETHLIPNIVKAALEPALGPVRIFGNDYPTADGTCVRDYIHVEDLCDAHLRAVDWLGRGQVFGLQSGLRVRELRGRSARGMPPALRREAGSGCFGTTSGRSRDFNCGPVSGGGSPGLAPPADALRLRGKCSHMAAQMAGTRGVRPCVRHRGRCRVACKQAPTRGCGVRLRTSTRDSGALKA